MEEKKQKNEIARLRQTIYRITSDNIVDDLPNQIYDVISTVALIVNLTAVIMNTYDGMHEKYGDILNILEAVTVAFFAIDYVMRLLAAKYQFPKDSELGAIRKYALSFYGIIDILSFLPYYLPVFFPAGASAFRMVRVIRIMRLFRINAYFDSLNVITEVLKSKKQQLLSSVMIILILMIGSSLCMYSVENEAQPDVFSNAFSGIWWASSTLLTVGYGDIYPVTSLGKLLGIFISFLGVGMVAIPTGIISAGFVEQYQRLKKLTEYAEEEDITFINVTLTKKDAWVGKEIKDLGLPRNIIVAAVRRGSETIVPRGNVELKNGDNIILGSDTLKDGNAVDFKEIVLHAKNPWNGMKIKDLDISRQSFIVMIKRGNEVSVPFGDLVLLENDKVIMYSRIIKASNDELT